MIKKDIFRKLVLLYICIMLIVLPSCNTLNVPNIDNKAGFSAKYSNDFDRIITLSRNYVIPSSQTENKVKITPVMLGEKIGDALRVSGVKAGDKVVQAPNEKLLDGATVVVAKK